MGKWSGPAPQTDTRPKQQTGTKTPHTRSSFQRVPLTQAGIRQSMRSLSDIITQSRKAAQAEMEAEVAKSLQKDAEVAKSLQKNAEVAKAWHSRRDHAKASRRDYARTRCVLIREEYVEELKARKELRGARKADEAA